MKNRISKIICLALTITFMTCCWTKVTVFAEQQLYLGGFATGFQLSTKGVTVLGLSEVVTKDGVFSPAKESGIMENDKILTVNGVEISSSADLSNALSAKEGAVILTLTRAGKTIVKEVEPITDLKGNKRLGLFLREGIAGIGTVTFVKGNGEFMSLGHSVSGEGDAQQIIGGNIYRCSVIGVNRGSRGRAGELKGVFIKDNAIGTATKNTLKGLIGSFNESFDYKKLPKISIGKAEPGAATIITSIDGRTPKEYSVSLVKVDYKEKKNRNFVIKIDDESLITAAGGIVQGMSGSPIIQNGRLVGAVTHVFVNDPTRGYGIGIANMLAE